MPEDYQAIKVKSMTILRGRWLSMSRMAGLFIIFFMLFSVSPSFMKIPAARADNWVGWDAIDTIYYNPAQEDVDNPFLETAASELETYLEQMSGHSWTVVTSAPTPPSINLAVNATMLADHGDEAFRLLVDSNGVTITGKTAIGCRWGAYYLLDEKLGVRWFLKGTTWTIVPTTLASLSNCDEIHEPDFYWRQIWGWAPDYGTNKADFADWVMHNRGYGEEVYGTMHSYGAILDYNCGWYSMTDQQKQAYYDAHPTYFLQNGLGISYWQLNPESTDVQNMAIAYTRHNLDTLATPEAQFNDYLYIGSSPVSPNDGGMDGFYPYTTVQQVTDKVFGLANAVAANISGDYPGKYVGVLDYASCSAVPSITLQPNILAVVTTGFNFSNFSNYERIQGLLDKGVKVGIYDYLELWNVAYADLPRIQWDKLSFIKWVHDRGVGYYVGETTDTWGGRCGITNYLCSKLLWDSSLNIDDLLNDFYTKAFGAAASVMKHYYEIRDTDNEAMAKAFNDLNSAEALLSGDANSLARVRQLEYYTRYQWKFNNVGITNLTLSDLENFYTFDCKIRDTYMVSYVYSEGALRTELKNRGLSDAQVNALQDFTPPTSRQAATWLAEGIAAFSAYGSAPDPINPRLISLKALGDNVTPAVTPLFGNSRDILIPSIGSENITVKVKLVNYEGTQLHLQWINPCGVLYDTWNHVGAIDWTEVTFATKEPGNYMLHATWDLPLASRECYIDVPNRPAAIVCDSHSDLFGLETDVIQHNAPWWYRDNVQYFYVPSGTSNFAFHGTGSTEPNMDASGKLTSPSNVDYTFDFINTTDGYITVSSPESGLWKLTLDMNTTYNYFWFTGIPPLVWHDPKYLLVPAGSGAPSQPAGDSDINGDGVVNVLDIIRVAQHWGETGANGWIREDVNNDGTIDILDITIVGQHWTG